MKRMNALSKKALLFLGGSLLFLSCKTTEDVKQLKFVTTDNKVVANVTIKSGSKVLGTSDKEGNFQLDQEKLKPKTVLTFEHEDYIQSFRVLNDNKLASVSMKPRSKAMRISSKEGAKLTTKSKVTVEIPENAFVQNGKPYNGEIDITISTIDASNSFDLRSAPAPFIAQESDGNLVPLTSYGMIEILAETPKGIPVDLAEDVSIGISIPVTTDETPGEVNLYELSAETGYWSPAGVLKMRNGNLLGEITSVNSSWNADDPCSATLICVKVKIEYTSSTCNIGAEGLSYNGFDGHYTPDSQGYVYFDVCPNSVFELQACYVFCTCPGGSGAVHTKMIDLSTITTNPSGCTDLGTWVIP